MHLGAFPGGVNQIPCHFSCREPPKCSVGATGPQDWGLGVPSCLRQAGGVKTQGAGAALTAGEETAGKRRGTGRGARVGEGGSEAGARAKGALLEGQGKREGSRAKGRWGGAGAPAEGAADRDVGPVVPRDTVRARGGASRAGGAARGTRFRGARAALPPGYGFQGWASGPHTAAAAKERAHQAPAASAAVAPDGLGSHLFGSWAGSGRPLSLWSLPSCRRPDFRSASVCSGHRATLRG